MVTTKSKPKAEPVEAPATWQELLATALDTPGAVNQAFTAFHNYSFGNVLLAWSQLRRRKLPLGPIATYNKWASLGRQVRKGEESLILCQPSSFKKIDEETGEERRIAFFKYKRGWFTLAQTDGPEIPMPELPAWEYQRALVALDVTEQPFVQDSAAIEQTWAPLFGNVLGYYRPKTRTLHISPLDPYPLQTCLHELAHSILHSDGEGAKLERVAQEVEAELTVLLVSEALGLDFAARARGYVQEWMRGHDRARIMTNDRSRRILKAADVLLKAGQPVKATSEEDAA
jgi:antirestriction protein ArdC